MSTKKIIFKRKRNISTALSSYPLTSSHKSKNIKNTPNSMRLVKINSLQYLKDKPVIGKSIYDMSINSSNIMTPQNGILLKDSISSSRETNRKLLDNKSIFNSIKSKIESILILYKKNTIKLNIILKKIDNFINSIIINKEIYNKSKSENNNKIQILSLKKKNSVNSNDENKNKLNSSNEKNEGEDLESENNLLKRKINKLYQKINEMEIKFKIDELNYFFCIGEHQKKINELEKKLNMKNIDKMPKEDLKQFLCYPHYIKFDVREDINPKSIPMFNLREKKCKTSTNRGKNTISYINHEDKLFENYLIKINEQNDNNIKNNIIYEVKNDGQGDEEKMLSDKGLEIKEIKNTIKLGKKQFDHQIPIVDKFFGKKKSFFISHPKLNYIKVGKDGNQLTSWKIDNQLNNFPQQISKLKMSKSQKNAMIVFPSSFNETMVNLEKLRTNKNFKSIENKFEETLKLNKKYNKNEK